MDIKPCERMSYDHACELLGDGTWAITWTEEDGRPNWYQVNISEAGRFCYQWGILVGKGK